MRVSFHRFCIALLSIACIWHTHPTAAFQRFPIVYSDSYNFGPSWLSAMHPFNGHQYRMVFEQLRTEFEITHSTIHAPSPVTPTQLSRVHAQEYIDRLFAQSSAELAQITGIKPLRYAPNWISRNWLLTPMLHAAGGTLLAVELARTHGWAINLGGGFHHAKHGNGQGGCAIADVPLAVCRTFDQRRAERILIIDLDAHQANGIEELLLSDPRVRILDIYEAFSAPARPEDLALRKQLGQGGIDLPSGITDDAYLELLETCLHRTVQFAFSSDDSPVLPDIIIYLAGTDLLQSDPHSYSALSPNGIIQRDAFVFSVAQQYEIPIAIIMFGGYSPESANVMAESIGTILMHAPK